MAHQSDQRAEQFISILVVALLWAALRGVEAYGYRFKLALLGDPIVVEPVR